MKLDLTGINNCNEYYTSHYFTSMFPEGAFDAIKGMDNGEGRTPWSQLQAIGRKYGLAQERYKKIRNNYGILSVIKDLADSYLSALGYPEANPFLAEVADGTKIPVYLEIKKANGAPLLWVVLAQYEEEPLKGNAFEARDLDGFADQFVTNFDNETLADKAFFGFDEAPRWLLFIGIDSILLLDRNKWNQKKYLEFSLNDIYGRREQTTFMAMSVLLGRESVCPSEGQNVLDQFDDESQRNASGVSKDLKYALRESIELLGNEVLFDMKNRQGRDLEQNPVDPGELTLQCLRYMYRMLFVLFIEARPELGYAPMKSEVYMKGYSLEHLRDVADSVRSEMGEIGNGYFLDDSMKRLYGLIYNGYHPESEQTEDESIKFVFQMEPLKAHIFDPDLTSMITNARLRNSVLLRIIDLMSMSRGDGKSGRGRISYSALGINQMGSVYEALLSYRGFIAQEDLYEVKRAGDQFDELEVGYFIPERDLDKYEEDERVRYRSGEKEGKLHMYPKGSFIYRLAGREREKSASYYTPECLTKCLVKYALKELLKDKTADQILELKICEPAMGSAAFLNEAINQLADAYVEKKEKELGKQIPYDQRFSEIQKVKMFIADRNVYGIDLNPTAVELAEVSLWLNTICEGGYIPWFGTQIQNGNSLIGARKQVYPELMISDYGLKSSYVKKHEYWYENAPTQVPYNSKRIDKKSVYHFLLGDPGMANYGDKVIKALDEQNVKLLKKKVADFCKPYNSSDVETLQNLSSTIDTLWTDQVILRKKIVESTSDQLDVWGHKDRTFKGHMSIKQKDETYKKIYRSEHMANAGCYARLKFAMDYWCALWFWPIDKAELFPTRGEYLIEMDLILNGVQQGMVKANLEKAKGHWNKNRTAKQLDIFDFLDDNVEEEPEEEVPLGVVDIDQLCTQFERLALVRQIANDNHFFHWGLEFADIFHDRGGFDLIIGNPPWIKIEWAEDGILSDMNPLFAVKRLKAAEVASIRHTALSDPNALYAYFCEYVSITSEQNFLNAACNYKLLKGVQTNLYVCFLPQAWSATNKSGVSAFIHPDSIYTDPKASQLRETMFRRLRFRFHFANEKKLFQDIKDYITYCLNIYGSEQEPQFDSISNLYIPSTIDDCYESKNTQPTPGIKTSDGDWCTTGHPNRVLRIGKEQLVVFQKVFDNQSSWEGTKLPVVHSSDVLDILEVFTRNERSVASLGNDFYTSEMWHEVNSQKDGTILRDVHFPKLGEDIIFSGPHINVATPIYKTSNRVCKLNSDYTWVDLSTIDDDYCPRVNYSAVCGDNEYSKRTPMTNWGQKITSIYRIFARKMINKSSERTLVSCIGAKGASHINGIIEFCFRDVHTMVLCSALWSSLPFDFLIKVMGKANLNLDSVASLPIISCGFEDEIISRCLLLNCVTNVYAELYEHFYKSTWHGIEWAIKDDIAQPINVHFTKKWSSVTPLRTPYERRKALVELDVLVAMALGMTLNDLLAAYKIQFPVLQSNENDTWYDINGRIVFTNSFALSGVGLDRPSWEKIAPVKNRLVEKSFMDDTTINGPIERTMRYQPPFIKCEREKDYKIAWKYFENKYGGSLK